MTLYVIMKQIQQRWVKVKQNEHPVCLTFYTKHGVEYDAMDHRLKLACIRMVQTVV